MTQPCEYSGVWFHRSATIAMVGAKAHAKAAITTNKLAFPIQS
jgi:hypothetical protein